MSKQAVETKAADAKPKKNKTLSPEQETQRRDFLKVSVAAGIGVCAIGAPVCTAVRLVTSPAVAARPEGKFYPITTLHSLTERPQKFTIVESKHDAWQVLPQQKIGALFLRKTSESVQALHALCPHAGCMLQVGVKTNPQSKIEEELFYCPCHAALFDLDGNRLNTVAPRNMDSFEVKIESEQVFIKFEHFIFGISEKKVS